VLHIYIISQLSQLFALPCLHVILAACLIN
jgi:hypothetical protein